MNIFCFIFDKYSDFEHYESVSSLPGDAQEWAGLILNDSPKKSVYWTYAHLAALDRGLPEDFTRWELMSEEGLTVAHVAAFSGNLPSRFDQWNLQNADGWTVAHVAAEYGHLPEGFDQWQLAQKNGFTVAHVAARHGGLPPGFDRWAMANLYGRTVAHVAAEHGGLPPGFGQWALSEETGWTVAHDAAGHGHLPEGFDQWILADCRGWTVAHVAAAHGGLPRGFDQWKLADENGWTVAHVAAGHGGLPAGFNLWGLADRHGRTVAHVAAGAGGLPPEFDGWSMADRNGWTVAHVAAGNDCLPAGFEGWGMATWSGWTIAHVAGSRGGLPPDFRRWDLAGRNGRTVAHAAGEAAALPDDFDLWDLADAKGLTVAHELAFQGGLPERVPDDVLRIEDGEGFSVAEAVWSTVRFGHSHDLNARAKAILQAQGKDVAGLQGWAIVDEDLDEFQGIPPRMDCCQRNKNYSRHFSFEISDRKKYYSLLSGQSDPVEWNYLAFGYRSSCMCFAHIAARRSELPSDFSDWELYFQDYIGEKAYVAHYAAKTGVLPKNFDKWDLIGNEGSSVAHLVIINHSLPDYFDRWHLTDKLGRTVAHIAAAWGVLPDSVSDDVLHYLDDDGISVAETAWNSIYRNSYYICKRAKIVLIANGKDVKKLQGLGMNYHDLDETPSYLFDYISGRRKRTPLERLNFNFRSFDDEREYHSIVKLPKESSEWSKKIRESSWDSDVWWTCAHLAAERGELPAGFEQWEIKDSIGWTVAHVAVGSDRLPDGFDKWELASKNGWTVAHEAARLGRLNENVSDEVLLLENNLHVPVARIVWSTNFIGNGHNLNARSKEILLRLGFRPRHLRSMQGAAITEADLDVRDKSAHYMFPDGKRDDGIVDIRMTFDFKTPQDEEKYILARRLPGTAPEWLRTISESECFDGIGYTCAHLAAKLGELPPDFTRWDARYINGWNVACYAALHDNLSENFSMWNLAYDLNTTAAHNIYPKCKLPNDFVNWEMAITDGTTVAHTHVRSSSLPTWFDRWDMRDNKGKTVAHVAAVHGNLPQDFNKWYMLDSHENKIVRKSTGWRKQYHKPEISTHGSHGNTVAHIAARCKKLPDDFDQWELRGISGQSVAHDAAKSHSLPVSVPDSVLRLTDNDRVSVANVILSKNNVKEFPISFLKRAVAIRAEMRKNAKTSLS